MMKFNRNKSFTKLRQILGSILIIILLVGSLGVTFMPMKAYASTTIRQGNKIVNTSTSETLIYDGSKHESTVYAGVIKRNGETVLNYLFSEDITRSSVVFDNLRKALPNPFSDMVPSVIEEQTKKGLKEMSATVVNNIDISTVSGDWKEAGSIAAQIYKDKDTSDSTNTLMYDASDECKSYIDEEAKEREEGLDDPIAADKRIISHLGTQTTDTVSFQVDDGQLIEVHNVNLIYLSEATTLIYTTVNVVDKTDSGVTKAPQAKNLIDNGQAQELVTAGTANGGTMQYSLGTKTEATGSYSSSIPTATGAGTYYVWYRVKGDNSHFDSTEACVASTIKKAISAKVTFKVVNGSWNDGKTEDKTVKLAGTEGDTLTLSKDQIPEAGSKPGSGYQAGNWDVIPSTSTAITKDTTYTYTFTKEAEGANGEASEKTDENASGKTAKVTKAPSAKKLAYNGKNQKLVVKGTASNGKMYYAVKKNTKAPKDSAYKTSIPTGNAAGTYYVWYKVKGIEGYKDSKAKKIKVTISGDPFNFNTSFKVTQKDGTIKVTWDKVNGFKKADVYVAYCDSKFSKKKYTTTTKNAVTIKKIDGKKIDQTKNIKLYLVGYDRTGKKKSKSVELYIAGKNNKKYTNVKSFSLSKKSISLKKGKSTNIKVTSYKLENSGMKELPKSYAANLRYRSTNTKIAKVNDKGKITAVKPGKCSVFVYSRNGLARKVSVKVTK